MEFSDINLRIQQIKVEIFELGTQSDNKLISKIDALRLINSLLREQNRLLGLKHAHTFRTTAA